jgi:ApaG protein
MSNQDDALPPEHPPASDPPPIRVRMDIQFLSTPERNDLGGYGFAYHVSIHNDGNQAATLIARHWVIIDGNGHVDEVRGPGVVGQNPTILPGQAFRYSSGTMLRTPTGTMEGEYLMELDDGSRFDAVIEAVALVAADHLL